MIAWPWIAMPAVLRPGLFQSVVLLPSRVMVKPAIVTLFAATWIVVPGRRSDRSPWWCRARAQDRDDALLTTTSSW